MTSFDGGGGATWPLSEGWERGETVRRSNNRATPKGLDQRSSCLIVVMQSPPHLRVVGRNGEAAIQGARPSSRPQSYGIFSWRHFASLKTLLCFRAGASGNPFSVKRIFEQAVDFIFWIRLFGLGTVFIYLLRYLDQETAKRPFRSSSQAATCYYQSNHSKVESIPLSAVPKDTTSELACLSPH